MLQARVTFSRSQIRCYVTIYAICCETTSNKTRVSPKHKARVNANMRLVILQFSIPILILPLGDLWYWRTDGRTYGQSCDNQNFSAELHTLDNLGIHPSKRFRLSRSTCLTVSFVYQECDYRPKCTTRSLLTN